MKYTLLLDNGHGKDTKGKCSPAWEGERLYEWRYNRAIVDKIIELAPPQLKVVQIVPEDDDISLKDRCSRINEYVRTHKDERCVMVSVHGNAAGSGQWMTARGWEVWTTPGQNNSDKLAECIAQQAQHTFATKIRTDKSDGDLDKEANFYIIKNSNLPCCLTENLFYDNMDDLKLMQNESVQYAIAQAHIFGVLNYFGI